MIEVNEKVDFDQGGSSLFYGYLVLVLGQGLAFESIDPLAPQVEI